LIGWRERVIISIDDYEFLTRACTSGKRTEVPVEKRPMIGSYFKFPLRQPG
jgi:hypothetical protein